jgi:hypothetical protein
VRASACCRPARGSRAGGSCAWRAAGAACDSAVPARWRWRLRPCVTPPALRALRPDSYLKMDNFYTVTVYEKV